MPVTLEKTEQETQDVEFFNYKNRIIICLYDSSILNNFYEGALLKKVFLMKDLVTFVNRKVVQ